MTDEQPGWIKVLAWSGMIVLTVATVAAIVGAGTTELRDEARGFAAILWIAPIIHTYLMGR